jgi:hypothetical protein
VDGELLLEAHPPVDAQGQSFEPNVDQFAEMLRAAVGDTTVAIHWDYAREVLQKSDGVIATVALEANDPNAPEPEPGSEPGSAPSPAGASPPPAGAPQPQPAAPKTAAPHPVQTSAGEPPSATVPSGSTGGGGSGSDTR